MKSLNWCSTQYHFSNFLIRKSTKIPSIAKIHQTQMILALPHLQCLISNPENLNALLTFNCFSKVIWCSWKDTYLSGNIEGLWSCWNHGEMVKIFVWLEPCIEEIFYRVRTKEMTSTCDIMVAVATRHLNREKSMKFSTAGSSFTSKALVLNSYRRGNIAR